MNHVCSMTAIPLSIAAVAFIAGEVALHVKANQNVMSKFRYSRKDLDQWGEFCQKYNVYNSKSDAMSALDSGELNAFKPNDVKPEMFGVSTGIRTIEVYCDQVAVVQNQVTALKSLKDGLETKKTFTGVALALLAASALVEVSISAYQGMTSVDKDTALGKLISCHERVEKTRTKNIATLEGRLQAGAANSTTNKPCDSVRAGSGKYKKIKKHLLSPTKNQVH